MPSERFGDLVAEALDALPSWARDRMDNVEVLVEDYPPPDNPDLMGLYQGIPLTERGSGYAGVLPDTITLYRSTILAESDDDEKSVRAQVRRVVAHEVAHFFGISDDRLHELDAY